MAEPSHPIAGKLAAGLAITLAAALPATLIIRPDVRLVWNVSASAPKGLYLLSPYAKWHRGDIVIAWPPARIRAFAASRHYLPSNVPLVKRIVGQSGDRLCARGERLFLNGRLAATRQSSDWQGRPMPSFQGCQTLRPDQLLLLMDHPLSFDGRYFGLSSRRDILGKATLLWRV